MCGQVQLRRGSKSSVRLCYIKSVGMMLLTRVTYSEWIMWLQPPKKWKNHVNIPASSNMLSCFSATFRNQKRKTLCCFVWVFSLKRQFLLSWCSRAACSISAKNWFSGWISWNRQTVCFTNICCGRLREPEHVIYITANHTEIRLCVIHSAGCCDCFLQRSIRTRGEKKKKNSSWTQCRCQYSLQGCSNGSDSGSSQSTS